MKHYTVHFGPQDLTAVVHEGATLLEAAEQVGIILATPCGGAGRCGKCKLILLPSHKEVLACSYTVQHDLQVKVPHASLYFKQQILEHGITHKAVLEPSVRKLCLKGPHHGIDDLHEKLAGMLNEPLIIRDESGLPENASLNQATAVLVHCSGKGPQAAGWQLTALEPGDTTATLYGLAVDIGTTTVVGRLVDLTRSHVKATVSRGNPQASFGGDVISRISFSETPEGLDRLHTCIVACLNELVEEASNSAGIDASDIYEVVAAGNTTMNHLLLKYPVTSLGQAPYHAYSLDEANRRPAALGIRINPTGSIYTLANIAGFVGSDTVAAALACQLEANDDIVLLVDIGTNGEIVLAANKRMTAASCAAGPALEGAGIAFGSRAQAGAIERVVYDGQDLDVDVIGGVEPVSICGSGLIDAAAVLLNAGIVDSTGRFVDREELDPLISDRMRKRLIVVDNAPAFILSQNNAGQPIYLTQRDIRQVQLAKAAIHAGIQLLVRNARLDAPAIDRLLLAGAFGNYIDRENAVRIGLLPQIPLEKIHFVGNAAGTGAEMVLISRQARKRAAQLACEIEYLEIAHQHEFQAVFSESLLFPEK